MAQKGTSRVFTRVFTDASLERSTHSVVTSASSGQSSRPVHQGQGRGKRHRAKELLQAGKPNQSASASSGLSQANEGIPEGGIPEEVIREEGIPEEEEEGVPEMDASRKTENNITRCVPREIKGLEKSLNKRHVDMIKKKGLGAPLYLQVEAALQTQTVKDVAMLIDEKGILELKGTYIDLYELAPHVMGDPNEGDYVGPAVGIPKGFEKLKEMLKPPSANPNDKKRRRPVSTVVLRKLLSDMSMKNDPADDETVMFLYRLYVFAVVNAPSTANTVVI